MDGTLTVPCIDFVEMRRVVGIMEGDILEVIAKMPPKQREATHKALVDFELQALDKMQLMPGVEGVAQLLDERNVPRGLITRNVLESVNHFHSSVLNLSPFSPALARCFKPPKPAPDSLLHIAREWGLAPEQCMMVGDSPKDDIVCGNRARAVTVLIDVHGRYSCDELPEEQQPDFYVQSMEELQGVLTNQCQLG